MLILIGGGSCAGKSTLSGELVKSLKKCGISSKSLSTDLFYHQIPEGIELEQHNFDSPESLDLDLMTSVCRQYDKETIQFRAFDFRTHQKTKEMTLEKSSLLILEGIFAFYSKEILNQADLRIFVDSQDTVRYQRRYRIYSDLLGHSKDFIDKKYFHQAEPFFHQHILPNRAMADEVLSGEKDPKTSADSLAKRIAFKITDDLTHENSL